MSDTPRLAHAKLVQAPACIAAVFESEAAPSLRTWEDWKKQKIIPFVKIGRLCFFDPDQVRETLAAKFTVRAKETAS